MSKPFLSQKPTTIAPIYNTLFKNRVEDFYLKYAPQYLNRIPYILEAYQENPHLLFGDLDHNYQTHESNGMEKYYWNNEPYQYKKIRIKVAEEYIFRCLGEKY